MEKPIISIIIPVYNDEDYLRQALDSVESQTLQDIEIICVNDGSTDGTAAILREYARRDERVGVIEHRKNRGLLPARKTGVEAARGEYCLFLDGDDELVPECCETVYALIREQDTDIMEFSIQVREHRPDGEIVDVTPCLPAPVDRTEQVMDAILRNVVYGTTVWNKLYRTAPLKTAHAAMEDFDNTIGEDVYESFCVAFFAKTFRRAATKPLYLYHLGRGVSKPGEMPLEVFRAWCGIREFSLGAKRFLERENAWEENRHYWHAQRGRILKDCFDYMLRTPDGEEEAAADILLKAWGDTLGKGEITVLMLKKMKRSRSWIKELENAKDWHQEQLAAKDARLSELESWTAELDKAKVYCEEQLAAKDARIAELESWTAELEKAKTYHEEQLAAKDARIAELEGWTAELEKAKTYHEEQLTAKDARIAELESWTAEQDKAKEWLLGQIGQKDRQIKTLEEKNARLQAALKLETEKNWH